MASLLDGVLPYIFSQGDRAKRYAKSLLDDPMGSLAQTAGGLVDAAHEQQALQAQAFGNPQRPFQVTDKQALDKAIDGTMQGVMGFAPAGITVYHGSPHVFDKFDSSKIGTGEGAQAYGHGLYLAEAPAVAKQYAGDLSAARATQPVGNVDLTQAYQNLATDVPDKLLSARRDFRALQDAGVLSPSDRKDFLAAVKQNIVGAQGGNMYKVDLPDSAVAKMLDWDKPLSQQSENVKSLFPPLGSMENRALGTEARRLRALGEQTRDEGLLRQAMILNARREAGALPETQGQDAYKAVMTAIGEQPIRLTATQGSFGTPGVAQWLRESGVPGIRYLDGSSRGAGQGSSNFVVFPGEESLLQILERNGQPLR